MGVLGKHPIPFLLVIVCGFLCFLMLQLSLLLFCKTPEGKSKELVPSAKCKNCRRENITLSFMIIK